ncbi:MAG TPA: hypothetical protein VFH87_14580 [Candidatus Udaeobacter sp.]|nr:hypothetical protein [Candidatus Udaeobacter sp.]
MKFLSSFFLLICAVCEFGAMGRAFGHGFAGARFFPATLSTDDPFVSDELSLPTVSTIRTPEEGGTRETDISMEISKRITPDFAIEIGDSFTVLNPHEGRAANGFSNLELGGKYQLLKNGEHEAIASIGLGVEVGGTGGRSVGADSFSTWTPGFFFGKGFGDLPASVRFLKPFAITGQVGIAIPTSASTRSVTMDAQTGEQEIDVERHPNVLEWGFALEYSLIYLQSQVQDVGLRAPFDRLIPLVEFALETPLNRGEQGQTTGTINPGIIWAGKYFQVGVEAVVPINERTGNNVGVIAQLHFFVDDLFPHSLGRPLFGGNK